MHVVGTDQLLFEAVLFCWWGDHPITHNPVSYWEQLAQPWSWWASLSQTSHIKTTCSVIVVLPLVVGRLGTGLCVGGGGRDTILADCLVALWPSSSVTLSIIPTCYACPHLCEWCVLLW